MSNPSKATSGGTAEAIAHARSFLFVPANRPDRFDKALASGADAVVLDLEDSVPPSGKSLARAALTEHWARLSSAGVPLLLRVNATSSASGADDLAWLAQRPTESLPHALMVPKVESPDDLEQLVEVLGSVPLLALIETAAGFTAVRKIASARRVLRLVVGHIDFMADTGIRCSEDEVELAPLRFAVAMATRTAGLAPAVDGVTVDIADERRLGCDTRRALRFGFAGKLCIHPRQVDTVHAAMRPTEAETEWARRVIEADAESCGAAVQLDGRMVDAPVVLQARTLLARLR